MDLYVVFSVSVVGNEEWCIFYQVEKMYWNAWIFCKFDDLIIYYFSIL